jgi:SAM-dependent methyltransferase
MGSQAIQGKLWGQRPQDWAHIQEQTGLAGYNFVLQNIAIIKGINLLDIGCGTGYFCKMAADKGAAITGIDASEPLIHEARQRLPNANFLTGEMEELPFADDTFDIVTGFNSFQYAAQTQVALTEAYRVLKPGGKLAAMIWGDKQDCEAATYLKAVGSLLPPPPPGAPGPFALSEDDQLQKIVTAAGFKNIQTTDIPGTWQYPNTETALRGLISAGPVARAIDINGYQTVYNTIAEAIKPYIQDNGEVVYRNKFRVVIGKK